MALTETELAATTFDLNLQAAAEEYFDCDTDCAKAILALIAASQSRVPANSLKPRHLAKLSRELGSTYDRDLHGFLLYRIQAGDADPHPLPPGYERRADFIATGANYLALQGWAEFTAAYLSGRASDMYDHFFDEAEKEKQANSRQDREMASHIAAAMHEATAANDHSKAMAKRPPDVEAEHYKRAYEEMVVPTRGTAKPVPRAELSETQASERAFSLAASATRAHPSHASPISGRMTDPVDYPLTKLTSKAHERVPMIDTLEKTSIGHLQCLIAMLDVNEAAARQSTSASFLKGGGYLSAGKMYPRVRKALVEMKTIMARTSPAEAAVSTQSTRRDSGPEWEALLTSYHPRVCHANSRNRHCPSQRRPLHNTRGHHAGAVRTHRTTPTCHIVRVSRLNLKPENLAGRHQRHLPVCLQAVQGRGSGVGRVRLVADPRVPLAGTTTARKWAVQDGHRHARHHRPHAGQHRSEPPDRVRG